MANIELSIVIPVYNEKENIPVLTGALEKVLDELKVSYEIIYVDDGSSDGTPEEISRLHHRNPQVKLISLSRNFGHQVALSAGLDHVQGAAVIMMDGDMQHPPELLHELVSRWKEGYDIVYTIRRDAEDAKAFKKWSASLFYWLINRLTKIPVPVGAADFRLMDRRVADKLRTFQEQSRFFRGLVSWIGFRQTGVPYTAPARTSGASGYSMGKMIRLALDGITSFSSFPLRIATYMGIMVSCISFIYGIYTLWMALFSDKVVPGWASLMLMVLFLGGVQLLTLGILGEYIGRIYEQVKGRPLYIVMKTLGDIRGPEK